MWTHTVSLAHGRRAVATAQARVIEVSQGSGVCAALCIRRTRTLCMQRTLCRHVTIGTPMVIILLFDCLLTVFDECYTVPIVKNTQNHGCTNRHRSTKTVPTVYQSPKRVKNSQKTVKTAKMTIGVPIVTCLPILYQQCTNRQKKSKDSQTADK